MSSPHSSKRVVSVIAFVFSASYFAIAFYGAFHAGDLMHCLTSLGAFAAVCWLFKSSQEKV